MKALLLDASVLLAAFDTDDAHHESAAGLLTNASRSLMTLDLARYEVANVAVAAWGDAAAASVVLGAVERVADDGGLVGSDHELLLEAAQIAENHRISVYDASYVAAARRRAAELVSCDQRDLVGKGLAVTPAETTR